MATNRAGVGILKIAVYLHEGEEETVKVWRFDGDHATEYTQDRVEREVLQLFPHVEKKGFRLQILYLDDLAGKVQIDSNADVHNALETFIEEWQCQNPRSYLELHV